MTCHAPPFASAVLAEATRISPRRRTSSDGVCGDAAHQARVSDHNPSGPHKYAHAVDISQSTPGSPYWDPKYSVFDAHAYGLQLAAAFVQGRGDGRIKYLVSNYGKGDVIFDPSVSLSWRPNATGNEHSNHLHVSFTVAAEQSTAPFFHAAPPPPPPVPSKPPVQEPSIDRGDDVKTIDIRNVPLDGEGNGWIDVHGISTAQVLTTPAVFGGVNPKTAGHYDRIPAVRIVSGSNPARLVFSGGEPGGHYNVRVAHS